VSDGHVHVSDLRWDQLLAGDLADDAKAAVLADADACPTCAARLAELRRESEAFAKRPPLVRDPMAMPWWRVPVMLATAAAVMLLIVRVREPDDGGERVKGSGPSLIVAAGPANRLVPVASGDRVRPGDSVQAGYSSERPGFGAVLARDGSGRAGVYVPARGDATIPLLPGDQRSFPESTVLDDIVGEEVIVVVWCEAPAPLAPLVAELEARGDITSRTGCTHRRVVLDKRAELR
jgi:hypothetical protein